MDHQGASSAAVLRLSAQYGLVGLRPEAVVGLWRRLEDEHMDLYLEGKTTFAGQRRARITGFFECFGTRLSPQQADEVFGLYLGFYERSWKAFPDVFLALDALGDMRKGVTTNGDPAQQRAKLEALSLAARLDLVVISGEAGASKPDPRIFHKACAAVSLEQSSCAYVGDRLETDALAARDAGMLGAWLDRRRFASKGPWLPNNGVLTVSDLTELVSCL